MASHGMGTETIYLEPEIVNQRLRTLAALHLRAGEKAADIGCGPGLLTRPMALAVGEHGRVVAVDKDPEALEKAAASCADQGHIAWKNGSAENLPMADDSMDALACTQVLLYVKDLPRALGEMRRVLKPGGRLAVVETDWRGVVFNSAHDAITRRVMAAWDASVASPNLPTHLSPLLAEQGFAAVRVEAIPILNTSYSLNNFSSDSMEAFAILARDAGAINEEEAATWIADFKRLGDEGAYFFCVNRFLFSAVRV